MNKLNQRRLHRSSSAPRVIGLLLALLPLCPGVGACSADGSASSEPGSGGSAGGSGGNADSPGESSGGSGGSAGGTGASSGGTDRTSGTSGATSTAGGVAGDAGSSGAAPSCSEAAPGAGVGEATTPPVVGHPVVTSAANSGPGSLRQAIADAAPGAVISFDLPGDAPTVTLSGQIDITKDVTLDGSSEPGLVISAGRAGRAFGVQAGGLSLTLRHIRFQDGLIPDDYGGIVHTFEQARVRVEHCSFVGNVSRGGAIFVRDYSTLVVEDSRFEDNDGATHGDQEVSGGAIGTLQKCDVTIRRSEFRDNLGINGGGLYTIFSNLTIEDSIFVGNDSTPGKALGSPGSSIAGFTRGHGGAIYIDGASRPHDPRYYVNASVDGDAEGGHIVVRRTLVKSNRGAGNGGGAFLFGYPQDTVLVEDSMFLDNEVIPDNKPDCNGGGVFFGPTQATVRGSTFARNVAEQGGAVYWSGPGNDPAGDDSAFLAENSTFSANRAQRGGAIWTGAWYPPVTVVESCTFVENVATESGGAVFENNWGLTINNSLFSANEAPSGPAANQELYAGAGNLEYPRSSTHLGMTVLEADPALGALLPHGGSTWTFALPAGSPAVDAGVTATGPAVDQRGLPRDARPDIGAFERQETEPAPPLCE